jgi:hypothetical protein
MRPSAPASAEDIVGAEGRIAWLVDLCMRLEQEEHAAALRASGRSPQLRTASPQPG